MRCNNTERRRGRGTGGWQPHTEGIPRADDTKSGTKRASRTVCCTRKAKRPPPYVPSSTRPPVHLPAHQHSPVSVPPSSRPCALTAFAAKAAAMPVIHDRSRRLVRPHSLLPPPSHRSRRATVSRCRPPHCHSESTDRRDRVTTIIQYNIVYIFHFFFDVLVVYTHYARTHLCADSGGRCLCATTNRLCFYSVVVV